MTDASSRIAIVALLGTAGATSLLYLAARPTPPERMKAYSGPIGMLGRWAYWVTRPLLRVALALKLTANAMTGIGVVITLGAGALAAAGLWGWAAFLLVFGSWCDLIDGELARQTRTQGKAGAFLDSNLDRVSEIALFAGLGASFPDRAGSFWAVAALAASMMVSYARARGEGLGVACPNFGMERPHRVVLLMFAVPPPRPRRPPRRGRLRGGGGGRRRDGARADARHPPAPAAHRGSGRRRRGSAGRRLAVSRCASASSRRTTSPTKAG
jgi:CDP-diacylglycerol--glycerol-3-phosphate 3-phosphatidyltransferase